MLFWQSLYSSCTPKSITTQKVITMAEDLASIARRGIRLIQRTENAITRHIGIAKTAKAKGNTAAVQAHEEKIFELVDDLVAKKRGLELSLGTREYTATTRTGEAVRVSKIAAGKEREVLIEKDQILTKVLERVKGLAKKELDLDIE